MDNTEYLFPAAGALTGYALGQSAVYAAVGAAAGYAAWAMSDRGVAARANKPYAMTPLSHPGYSGHPVSIPPVMPPKQAPTHVKHPGYGGNPISIPPVTVPKHVGFGGNPISIPPVVSHSGFSGNPISIPPVAMPGHPKYKHTLWDTIF